MSDSQRSDQSPFTNRRFVLAAIVVGVVLLCAVVLVVGSVLGGQSKPTAGSSAAPSSSPSSSADSDPSVCGLTGYEAAGTLRTAPDSTWGLVGTVAAPSDPNGAGPGRSESSGFRSCYAHTPTGALYSAANVIAMGSITGLAQEVTEKLVVEGAGRDAALAKMGPSTSTSTVRYQIAGFKMLTYDGGNATVDVAVNVSTGELVSFVETLQWSGGDWKIVLDAAGNAPIPSSPLQSLGGYIPWSGA